MDTYSYSEARKELTEIINQVVYQKERFYLERRGKRVAAIIPIEDLELIEKLEDKIDIQESEKVLTTLEQDGTETLEKVAKELGLSARHRNQ